MDIRWHLKLLSVKLAIKLLKSTGWYEGYWNHWRGEVFDYSERQGLHIMPVHYYTPIPDVNKLSPKIWEPKKAITKINIDLNKSLEYLENLLSKYYSEYQIFSYKKQSDKEFYLGKDLRMGSVKSIAHYNSINNFIENLSKQISNELNEDFF